MLQATLNNLANLSLSNPVEGICDVIITGGTSGGVGSFKITSSVFVPALLVLKVIFAEGLQNPRTKTASLSNFHYAYCHNQKNMHHLPALQNSTNMGWTSD
jgi:hypothetical protein